MITKETLKFLNDISENNNRDWFADHKESYLAAKANVDGFGQAVFSELSESDVLEKLQLYRIYRDVRFSKDKSPYHKGFDGRLARATKYRRGGYYFHIEPGNNHVLGGFWRPNKEDLLRIRQEILVDADPFRKILADASFVQFFGTLQGEQLKTAPKGFPKDHPDVDLLQYKQFYVQKNFTDDEATSPDFVSKVVAAFQAMRPFFDYMSVVLTTDENGEEL